MAMPTEKHNPTAEERDERIGPFDVDPEEALEAILKVDPDSEPVKKAEMTGVSDPS
jgi:hypothetical protein